MATEAGSDTTRGVQYPGDSLAEAVTLLEKVRTGVGFASASRELIAQALGYKGLTGTSGRRVATLGHFDLIERTGNGSYKISDLGRRILMPTSEAEKALALAEAAKRPSLYLQVIAKYQGSALPQMLANILARDFKVYAGASEDAAKGLRETVEFAGLLRNGILYDTVDVGSEAPANPSRPSREETPRDPAAAEKPDETVEATSTGTYSIALGGDGRNAKIVLPLPITPRDLKLLRSWVEYMTVATAEETPEISSS